jgi:hypothetical protein
LASIYIGRSSNGIFFSFKRGANGIPLHPPSSDKQGFWSFLRPASGHLEQRKKVKAGTGNDDYGLADGRAGPPLAGFARSPARYATVLAKATY